MLPVVLKLYGRVHNYVVRIARGAQLCQSHSQGVFLDLNDAPFC